MAAVSTLPLGRPLTLEDFEVLRDGVDDGARYELVDGSLVVTPAPTWAHQVVLTALLRELVVSNPDEGRYVILAAPHDVHLGGTSVLPARPVGLRPGAGWPEAPCPRHRDLVPQHPPPRPGAEALPVRGRRHRALLGGRP